MNSYKKRKEINRELKGIYRHLNTLLDDALIALLKMKETVMHCQIKNKIISKEEQVYLDKFILDIEEISVSTEQVLDTIAEIPNEDSLRCKLDNVRKEFSTCKFHINGLIL